MTISSLTLNEQANIIAHYNRLATKAETNSIWDAYRERGVSEEQIAVLKARVEEEVGHEIGAEHKSLGFQFTRDLKSFEYGSMNAALIMHEMWEKGVMPDKGPLLDQSNKIIELMNLLSSLKAETTERLRKEQAKMEKSR